MPNCRLNGENPVFRAPLLFIFSIIILCFIIIIVRDRFTRVLRSFWAHASMPECLCWSNVVLFQAKHGVREIDAKQYQCFSSQADNSDFFRQQLLKPLLIERVSGTPGIVQARQHILSKLRATGLWDIELDTFDAATPVNISRQRCP